MLTRQALTRIATVVALAAVVLLVDSPGDVEAEAVVAPAANCHECEFCLIGHKMKLYTGTRFGYHSACIGAPTFCPHAYCEPQDDDADADDYALVVNQAIAGDDAALVTLQDAFGDKALLNFERQALQLIGCNNQLVAHIPLTSDQLVVLADVE
jgi:hypothetical protein